MKNAINWFEIPVDNFDRAKKFYSSVLSVTLHEMDFGVVKMAAFPTDGTGVGGALCHGEWYKPSQSGTLVYLNGGEDLSVPLSRVESAGGEIIIPKRQISEEYGYMAVIIDSEGNRIAFHSLQ
ncbi:MAG: lactoylglutathione lyase [Ignavibacteriae bacterium HGW-Ignavibacteriae-3]|nr:MAG: lactoylglutathione lyase [Ignavibacteriae bacterium HGW-Ignavibacteriae-3]